MTKNKTNRSSKNDRYETKETKVSGEVCTQNEVVSRRCVGNKSRDSLLLFLTFVANVRATAAIEDPRSREVDK